ncbi:hypothetical protein DEJ34_01210 [Curtobacterium sp. MCPF17_050]|uniref:hypothetical protein n=1 Tax=Curtobacterium sp. MCPF17_050 TaxID=2175664 RepID=UPI0011B49CE9|nr:hypothetical protein [Curtobacterium sp. MCPF17_050]WIB15776.1 hypothetical protein DEJ34_01210 [Curtobacterium sp. MCPF17_050]
MPRPRIRQSRALAITRRTFRFLFPKRGYAPAAIDQLKTVQRQTAIIENVGGGSSFAILPLIGILGFILNIFARTQGNTNLAIAVVTHLPIGSIAMVILLNLMAFLLIASVNALAQLYGEPGHTARAHYFFGLALFTLILIGLSALSWPLFVILLGSAYVYWRSEKVQLRVRLLSSRAYLVDKSPPADEVLRALWFEGRWELHRRGIAVEANPLFPLTVPRPFRARSERTITQEIQDRQDAIDAARGKGAFVRLVTVFVVTISIFSGQLLSQPMNFAAKELVTTGSKSRVGFVVDTTSGILIVDERLRTGIYVSRDDVDRRLVCPNEAWAPTLPALLKRHAEKNVCAAFGTR